MQTVEIKDNVATIAICFEGMLANDMIGLHNDRVRIDTVWWYLDMSQIDVGEVNFLPSLPDTSGPADPWEDYT